MVRERGRGRQRQERSEKDRETETGEEGDRRRAQQEEDWYNNTHFVIPIFEECDKYQVDNDLVVLTRRETATGTMLKLRLAMRNSLVVCCLLPQHP